MKQKQTTQTSIRLERTVLIAPRTRSFRERECNSPWEGGSTPPLAQLASYQLAKQYYSSPDKRRSY